MCLSAGVLTRGVARKRARAQRTTNQECPPRFPPPRGKASPMTIIIGIDPHKASHTAVAIDNTEYVLDELRVRACSTQTDQLRAWAAPFPDRVWAIESATRARLSARPTARRRRRDRRRRAGGDVDTHPIVGVGRAEERSERCPLGRDHRVAYDALGRVVIDDHAQVLKLLVETTSRSRPLYEQGGLPAACAVDGTRARRHGQGDDRDQGKRAPRPDRTPTTQMTEHRLAVAREILADIDHYETADEGVEATAPHAVAASGDIADRHSRRRCRGRRDDHRPRRRHLPVHVGSALRELQRHRPDRSVIGRTSATG